ncbi:MAG: hypothetical protein WBM48_05595 [Polyangiales bacterium]
MEVGPIEVEDALLTLGFTKKPVVFQVDRAKVTVRRRKADAGPVIYIEEVEGHMLKPSPLPKPVPIAWANAVVRLVGKPLVELTVDSAGIAGAFARAGLRIAGHVKRDQMRYKRGAVKVEGGPACR